MNLRFLETFLWIARLGSFSAAAARLNTTQAAISHRIASLEADLGVQLFSREGRAVSLTLAGRRAIAHAEEIMLAVASFRESVADPSRMTGSVRIGTNDVIVHTFLSRFMDDVRKALPDITIDLSLDTSPALARDVLGEDIDMALVLGQIVSGSVTNVELSSFRSGWVAKADSSLAGRPLTLADVATHPLLTFSKDSAPYHWLLQQYSEAGLGAPKITNINSLVTIVQLAVDGFGITALPRAVVLNQLASGQLVEIDVTPQFPPFVLFASFIDRNDRPVLPMLAAICANAASAFARGG
jgi:DNA-binding transcriptional LysR family regulator